MRLCGRTNASGSMRAARLAGSTRAGERLGDEAEIRSTPGSASRRESASVAADDVCAARPSQRSTSSTDSPARPAASQRDAGAADAAADHQEVAGSIVHGARAWILPARSPPASWRQRPPAAPAVAPAASSLSRRPAIESSASTGIRRRSASFAQAQLFAMRVSAIFAAFS